MNFLGKDIEFEFSLFMMAFVKDIEFQIFFAKGYVLLHITIDLERLRWEETWNAQPRLAEAGCCRHYIGIFMGILPCVLLEGKVWLISVELKCLFDRNRNLMFSFVLLEAFQQNWNFSRERNREYLWVWFLLFNSK